MAEHREEPESEAQETLDQASPAAVALALGRTSKGGKALDAKAEAFLEKQTRLIDLQMEHLHEQRELMLSRLRWGRFSDRVKALLQVMTAIVGLVAAIAVAAMAWSAHQDHGVAIQAFSVPPDLPQRGLTGQVVASQLLDKLAQMQAQTVTARPASTYANDWGEDIRVEIPDTGVSVGEVNRYLRQWLGHQTRITGEIVRTPAGLAVTARAGTSAGKTVEGTDADLDGLMQRAAEAVYTETQPYRYAVYLASHGKPDEALSEYARMATSGAVEDRPWAYIGWSSLLLQTGRIREAADKARAALKLNPRLYPAHTNLSSSEAMLGHEEGALGEMRALTPLLRSKRAVGVPEGVDAVLARQNEIQIAYTTGDYQTVTRSGATAEATDLEGLAGAYQSRIFQAAALAANHDVSGSRRLMAQFVPPGANAFFGNSTLVRGKQAVALDDWQSVVTELVLAETAVPNSEAIANTAWPIHAIGLVKLGRQAEAEALVARTPLDCDTCVESRGTIAAAKRDWAAADRWFARAVRLSPSIPMRYSNWGAALLARGDVDGAITQFQIAHQKGPHWADPLELWGEALMWKGDFAGAVAKFSEADKDAPRWGRNHLRWGQALTKLGKADEAKAQWRAAAGMDLSAADRVELARVQASAPKRTS